VSRSPFHLSDRSDPRSRKKSAHSPRRPTARLELEALEDRSLPSCTTISGYVFYDANNNGLYEPAAGETPLANSQLELHNAAGQTIATATSNAQGYYEFTADSTISTAPTTKQYSVSFPTTRTNNTLTGSVAQFDPELGTLQSVEIVNSGTLTSDIRVENTSDTSPTTISATVGGTISLSGPPGVSVTAAADRNVGSFSAAAFDGAIDFTGASGKDFGNRSASATRSVTLTGSAMNAFLGTGQVNLTESLTANSTASGGGNVAVQIATTASAGATVIYHYIPSNCIRPGNYTVVEVTEPPGGYLDGKDSRNGTVLSNPPGTNVIPITVTSEGVYPHNDFGKLLPSSLSGYEYGDISSGGYNNGIKEPGEPGIDNTAITLTGTSDAGPVNLSTATDANGYYHFDNLRPGQYTITETQPPNWTDGKDTIGSQGGTAGNGVLTNIQLGAGVNGVNNNFGNIQPTSPPPPVISPPPLPPPGPPPAADLSIVKTASAPSVTVGSALTYTLTISNLGPNTATGVTVRDTLPPGVTFISAAGAGWQESQASGIVTFTTGSLAAGATTAVTVTILAPASPGTITNVGTVTSNTPDTNPNNNTSQVTTPVVAPPPTGTSEVAFAPTPSTFPSPGELNLVGKASLFTTSGLDSTDPTLLAQITWVEGLYRTLLGGPADTAGLVYWVRQLRAGQPRDQIVRTFWDSSSHRNLQIEALYQAFLGRAAGPNDLAYWNSVFAAGASETDVAILIATSPEFTASHPDDGSYINALYQIALGRSADGGAQSYWQGVINSGGRAAVARGILLSDEAQVRMMGIAFSQFLHRGVTAGEQQFWLGQLHSGLAPADMWVLVLSSDEFYNLAVATSQQH
jgi:uncharacterized repeat protein (TIGR01451 family)